MREVLVHIEKKKQEYAQLPFFQFVRDASIELEQRLAWAPYAAPFIMSFIDLNKYILREDPTSDQLQKIINRHTYEDNHHWVWFLEDLQNLGFNKALKFNDALRFLWGEETRSSRWLTYQLCKHAMGATPIQKVVVIETLEAAGNVQFQSIATVGRELQDIVDRQYLYFSDTHLSVEMGRTFCSIASEESIVNIQLTEAERQKLIELINSIFSLLTNWKGDLLVWAKAHSFNTTTELK